LLVEVHIIPLGLFCHCLIGWQTCSSEYSAIPETVIKQLRISK
jgi:hypothetical protein